MSESSSDAEPVTVQKGPAFGPLQVQCVDEEGTELVPPMRVNPRTKAGTLVKRLGKLTSRDTKGWSLRTVSGTTLLSALSLQDAGLGSGTHCLTAVVGPATQPTAGPAAKTGVKRLEGLHISVELFSGAVVMPRTRFDPRTKLRRLREKVTTALDNKQCLEVKLLLDTRDLCANVRNNDCSLAELGLTEDVKLLACYIHMSPPRKSTRRFCWNFSGSGSSSL